VQVIVVEVVDTGVGVTEEARKRLFSKFVQGSEKDMKKARAVSGTGLGLSICAKQVLFFICCR
jgi:signal transduction histidine kinase